jgi:hypothetical protein
MVHTADHDQARWQPQLCVIATKPWLATTLFGVSLTRAMLADGGFNEELDTSSS